jgi:hypothetical protein
MFTNQDHYAELNRLQQRANSGARWFYWIAALSLITSIAILSGSGWRFFISLGSTQLVSAIFASEEAGTAGKVIAILFDLLATGIFAGLGVLAGKRYLWSYVVGGVLFALDSLVVVFAQDWIGIAFHVFAVYCIVMGFVACRKLLELQREVATLAAAEASANALSAEAGSRPALPSPEGA